MSKIAGRILPARLALLALLFMLSLAGCGGTGGGGGNGGVNKGTAGAPTITSITPNAGPTSGGTSVTINGTNLQSGASVSFGGTAGTSVVVTGTTQMRVSTPSHGAGAVDVQITNPDSQSGTVTGGFTYSTAVIVTGVTPNSGLTQGGNIVSVNGGNFLSGATVKFGTVAATSVIFVSSSQLQVTVPAHAVGAVSVTVTNPDTTTSTLNSAYTYTSNVNISNVLPQSGSTNGGTSVTLLGAGFQNGATVTFGGASATNVVFVSSTQVTATIPAHAAGIVDVTLTNPDSSFATLSGVFKYSAPPVVANVAPSSGTVIGGTTVLLNGNGFQSGATVKFGVNNAASVTFVSATQLQVVTPAGALGQVNVVVTNPDNQTGTLANGYTYTNTLGITSISPVSGDPAGGTLVTITGNAFVAGATVTFGGVASPLVNFVNSTTLTAQTPAHVAGVVDVTVTIPGPASATLPASFNYVTSLSIGSVAPNSGPSGGGTTVLVNGTGFQPTDTVSFGGTFAATQTYISSTQWQATTPAHLPGVANVIVSPNPNPNGIDAILSNGFTFTGSVSITSVTPNTGTTAGGTAVSIQGVLFQNGATVTFGGTPATGVTFVNSQQLNVVTPLHAAGAVNVVVTNPDSTTATATNAFTYTTTIAVTSVTPTSGPASGGTSVTIGGANFIAGATVNFGSTAATNVVLVNASTITAKAPAGVAGPVNVSVVNPPGGAANTGTLNNGFTYTPVLSITSVSPNSGSANGGDTVTISGTNFVTGATVSFGGAAATSVTFVNTTQLTAVTPAHAAATVSVTVTNPDNSSATLASAFVYNVSKGTTSSPSISTISPNNGPSSGGTTVTITGSNFQTGITVSFGGALGTNVNLVSGSQLTVMTPARPQGTVDVVVTNTNGNTGTAAGGFTYTGSMSITSVLPASGSINGGTSVAINGAGFASGATVTIGGAAATNVVVVSASQITAKTPAHAAGAVNVVVTLPSLASVNANNAFTYVAPPNVTGVNPSSGPTAGGTLLTITGTNFGLGATLNIGGVATPVSFVNSTQLVANAPAHTGGTVNVTVTNPDGQSSALNGGYTYVAPLGITSISPNTGDIAGNTTVIITGNSFQSGAAVTFGGTAAAAVAFLSSTSLQAITPAHAAGAVNVVVTNPDTTTTTLTNGFTYTTALSVGGVSPNAGKLAGGNVVTVSGTGFVAGATVTFGAAAGMGVSLINSSQLQVTVPAGAAPGPVSVTVTIPGPASATLVGGYSYDQPVTVTGVVPNSGSASGGDTVTINGTSFQPGAIASFNSVDAQSMTFVSTTQLTAVTPANPAATVSVTVTNPDGSSGTLVNGFTYNTSKGTTTGPTFSSVNPTHGPAAGGTSITINGGSFQSGLTVTVGGIACQGITVVTGGQITCTTGASTPGPADIVITNPDGSKTTAVGAYFYDGLTIISVTPGVVDVAGGTPITIAGTGFQVGASVLIGVLSASSINVASATQITAISPAVAAGTYNVTVHNPDNTTFTLNNAVKAGSPPKISAVQPTSGLKTGGTTVTLTGIGFQPGVTITFGGIPGTSVNVINGTQLTVVTPAHAIGTVDVVLTNPDNGTTTVSGGFRYGQVVYSSNFESCTFAGWDLVFNTTDWTINTNPLYVDPAYSPNKCSAQVHYHVCGVNVPNPLTGISQVAGGALPTRTYYIKYTYQNFEFGETLPSLEQTITVNAGSLLTIPSPPAQVDLQSYNVYVSTSPGTETKQNAVTIPLGTAFTEPATGLIAGAAPPTVNFACGAAHQDRNRFMEKDFTSANGYPNGINNLFIRGYVYFKSPVPGASIDGQRKMIYFKDPNGTGGSPAFHWCIFLVTDSVNNGHAGVRWGWQPNPSTLNSLYGSSSDFGNNPNVVNGIIELPFDQWMSVEVQIHPNDPNVNNAELRLWVNGNLVYQKTNWQMRDPAYTLDLMRVEVGRQIDRGSFVPMDELRFWDDIVMGDSYIGP